MAIGTGAGARDVRQLWQAVLAELQLCMTRANFETYFKDTWGVGLEGQTLVVGVKNPFLQETLEQRFLGLIRRTLGEVAEGLTDVRLVAQGGAPDAPPDPPEELFSEHANLHPPRRTGGPRPAAAPAPRQERPPGPALN